MLTTVTIQGLGPIDHWTAELDPQGLTEIRGPSEAGKTTLLEAICLTLWGQGTDGRPLPVEAIREGAAAAEVAVTTRKGTKLSRTIDRKRRTTRRRDNGEAQVFSTEAEWASSLGPLCRTVATGRTTTLPARLVLVPLAWRELALGEGRGRPLRDLLGTLVPGSDADEVRRMMLERGLDVAATDALGSVRACEDQRRRARERAQQLRGALDQARRALVDIEAAPPATPPSADDVVEARETVRAAEAWRRYDDAVALQQTTLAAIASWDERREQLGDEPAGPTKSALADARSAAITRASGTADARRAVQAAERAVHEAGQVPPADTTGLSRTQERLRVAREALTELEAVPGACPTCGAPWEGAEQRLEEARQRVARAEEAAEEARLANSKAEEAAKRRALSATAAATETLQTVAARLRWAEEQEEQARRLSDELVRRASEREGWHAALRALGRRPEAPEIDPEPTGSEPDEDVVAQARTVLASADRADGALQAHQEHLARARQRAADVEAEEAQARQEAERVSALVEAVRLAPSSRLARGLDQVLGDTGPVRVVVDETGGCEILVDGRGWDRASTGRQIVADLYLRLALRRALRMRWWPCVVDRAQDWSGGWPALDGPVVLLRTTRDAEVSVVQGGDR